MRHIHTCSRPKVKAIVAIWELGKRNWANRCERARGQTKPQLMISACLVCCGGPVRVVVTLGL